MTKAIWWVRRDLRLTDNPALHTAITNADEVIPLLILDERLIYSPYASEKRTAFYIANLHMLDQALHERGSKLVVRTGHPYQVLTKLVQQEGISAIYAQQDYSPFAIRRDNEIAAHLPLVRTGGIPIRSPDDVLKSDGLPYTVYTPYRRKWMSHEIISRSQILPSPKQINTPSLISHKLPTFPYYQEENNLFPVGEVAAKKVLGDFIKSGFGAIYDYTKQRDYPEILGTSKLSPYLRFGLISARLTALAAYETIANLPEKTASEQPRSKKKEPEKSGPQVWLDELIWRDFYISILAHFPTVRSQSFRTEYDQIQWNNDETEFERWCQGKTGYPFVDAAMRQLVQTGWMHNRARMVVASFLVKDLLIDWRWGERWFMQQLLDGDPAANNGGWQWAAGTGTDAAPYFRIFNPITQSKRYDSQGTYIRRFVPELAQVSSKFIHEPWLMSKSEQIRSHCVIEEDYPAPIVDHTWARERTLAAYKSALGK